MYLPVLPEVVVDEFGWVSDGGLLHLVIAEKTRVISEYALEYCKHELNDQKADNKAHLLLVFKDAHSFIPEWNAAANEGD